MCGQNTGWELGAGFQPFTSCITWGLAFYYVLPAESKGQDHNIGHRAVAC